VTEQYLLFESENVTGGIHRTRQGARFREGQPGAGEINGN
jgi:hypothetical protein